MTLYDTCFFFFLFFFFFFFFNHVLKENIFCFHIVVRIMMLWTINSNLRAPLFFCPTLFGLKNKFRNIGLKQFKNKEILLPHFFLLRNWWIKHNKGTNQKRHLPLANFNLDKIKPNTLLFLDGWCML